MGIGPTTHWRRSQVCPSVWFTGFLLLNPGFCVGVKLETGLLEYACLRIVENLNALQSCVHCSVKIAISSFFFAAACEEVC